jgi:holo-[acyl-carrier protein] synthase
MVVGIGIDLVSVSRMEKILNQPWGNRFLKRVFSPSEISFCKKRLKPQEAFAARFAAKEALVKALGTGFSGGVSPVQIIVDQDAKQKPIIRLSEKASVVAQSKGINRCSVSISHAEGMACAMVVLEQV